MISNSTRLGIHNNSQADTNKKQKTPNFKGLGGALMNGAGWAMNSIENGGFVASFLIQDTAGMTVPRTREGLYRDRDKKKTRFKDLNFKEAGEVFIREFLSGPLMMFTPFAVFALTKKFIGKSTFTNTGLLKSMGKSFTNVVKNKQTAGNTAAEVKESFYRSTIKQMLKNTTPEANEEKVNNSLNAIYKHVSKLDELEAKKSGSLTRKRKKAIKKLIDRYENKIVKEFNHFHRENSSNFDMVNKVKVDGGTYNSLSSITAMRGYAADISKSKDIAKITEEEAKNFEKKSMIKRVFATIAASVATIGSTSIVPSLYAILNPVPPGAMDTQCDNPNHNHPSDKTDNKSEASQKQKGVAFKGNILRQLQFDGNQLTPLLMTTLAGGGLIAPRVHTAVKRAPIEDGKKNYIEIPEILTRDIISTLAVTFGVPVLTKAMVGMYEKQSGFVLSNKSETQTSKFKKVLDAINPLNGIGPYSNKEVKEIYQNIDNKKQLQNLAEFIDKKGGSLVKVFKTLKNGQSTFAGTEADFASLANLDRAAANKKIMNVIANNFDENTVKTFLEADTPKLFGIKLPKSKNPINGMYRKARNLNSTPRFINTIILVPAFLGVILPKIVYGITAKNRKKMEMDKANKMNSNHDIPINNTPSTLQSINSKSKTFRQNNKIFDKFKHNS